MERGSSPKLEHSFSTSPVTALAFFSSGHERLYILAGQDTSLGIYDVHNPTALGRFPVFHNHPIHGIHVSTLPSDSSADDASILVWGGRSVAVLPTTGIEAVVRGETPAYPVGAEAPDWVYDGSLCPYDSRRGVLVTAHNEVVAFRTNEAAASLTFDRPRSSSRPLLYSATTTWLAEDRVLIAGGTVFGEIIVWTCSLRPDAANACHVLHVFRGHEGSIFGVSLSDEITVERDLKVRLLASCSDDRTIRVWVVTEEASAASAARLLGTQQQALEIRETGFGDDLTPNAARAAPHEAGGSSRAVAVAMGHLSRIWHVKFARQTWPMAIYSFGEDATVQEWRLHVDLGRWVDSLKEPQANLSPAQPQELDRDAVGKLTHVTTMSWHSGKHIWASAVLPGEDSRPTLVATGGADGKIVVAREHSQSSPDVTSDSDGHVISFTVSEVLLSLSSKSEDANSVVADGDITSGSKTRRGRRRGDVVFQSYAFISSSELLVVSSEGHLYRADLTARGMQWTEIPLPEPLVTGLACFNVLKSPGDGTAFVGSAKGHLVMHLSTGDVVQVAQLPSKVDDIFIISKPATADTAELAPSRPVVTVVVTMPVERCAAIMDVDPARGVALEPQWKRVQLEGGDTVMSANFCQDYLVLGSRKGKIHLYERSDDGTYCELLSIRPGTRDAIKSITSLPPRPERHSSSSFLATCRDGTYRIYSIQSSTATANSKDNIMLQLQHETTSSIPFLVAGWFGGPAGQSPDLILCGFRTTKFILWNESRQEELAAVECGGGHRTSSYRIDPSETHSLLFAFTKAAAVHIFSQTAAPHVTLCSGTGHGREIRAVSARGAYLATGSEDTTIRLWKHQPQQQPPCFVSSLAPHISGLQCLQWVVCGGGSTYLLSSAGSEELFVWRTAALDSAYDGLGVLRESAYPDRTPDGDLRITSFDASADGGSTMTISLVLSNSTIKTYLYSRDAGWTLRARGLYTGACPTHIRHLSMAPGDRDAPLEVLVAFTDGTISIWRAASSGDYEMTQVVRAHRGAAKSLDVAMLDEGDDASLLVLSGGDDNALAAHFLRRPRADGGFVFGARCRLPTAHAAAVSGVLVLRADAAAVLAVTCSNDQRVKLWRIRLRQTTAPDSHACGVEAVQLLDDRCSSVADPGDMELLSDGQVMVVGAGMETWKLIC